VAIDGWVIVSDGGDTFSEFFRAARLGQPHPYQVRLAERPWPETLIIPTGFGKTAAILAAWLWKRESGDTAAPSRLVYCLPMRTLVEQTADAARRWVETASARFGWTADKQPLVHVLMGGEVRARGAPDWVVQVDRPAILIGTQDMLVSAALNRGYGASRFRWPVDFALLHTDALWVFDEVQLSGATLPTSAQLQAWRRDRALYPFDAGSGPRPAQSLWMSATLDPAWLQTVDFTTKEPARASDLQADDLAAAYPKTLWEAVKRLAEVEAPPSVQSRPAVVAHSERIVALVRERLRPGRTVLVFANTVLRAQETFQALRRAGVADTVLIHSRFRPQERAVLTRRATDRESPPSVIVTTQALEAGVDLTSAAMITELAPWPSMVQRIGRCNRYGECGEAGAEVLWIDLPPGEGAPYLEADLEEAREKLRSIIECGLRPLSLIQPGGLAASPVIRRRDLLDLFDTEADLSGFDVDVSMYVRDVDDVDVRLFWRDIPVPGVPEGVNAAAPRRDEFCPASIASARELLGRRDVRAWRIDRLSRRKSAWVELRPADLRPGLEVMVAADAGGYNRDLGLRPSAPGRVTPAETKLSEGDEPVTLLDDDPDTEVGAPVSLAMHSRHVRDEAQRLCDSVGIKGDVRAVLLEAALWHDRGKAHPAFQQMLSPTWREGGNLLAKSDRRPMPAGRPATDAEKPDPDLRRPRFRHELASMLAFLAEKSWSREADLCAYLIVAHHGKVRMRIRTLPEEDPPDDGGLFARGVHQGDRLPATALGDTMAPEVELDLDVMQLGEGEHGASWSARAEALLKERGPFQLAWLEALVRIADWRASRAEEYAAGRGLDPDTPWRPTLDGTDQ
jgi:CRISPR-associated endonuclease/helicase Cas3